MNKIPTWLKILLPVLLLLVILVAAVARLLSEEVPAHAQPAVLETRFSEQLAFLSELAANLPIKACENDLLGLADLPHDLDMEEDSDSRDELRAHRDQILALTETLEQWEDQIEAGQDLLADPVILAAEVLQFCDGAQSTFGVKSYEGPDSTWSAAMFLPADEQPQVSLWFAGMQRQVRYDTRIGDSKEDPLIIRLILDLEGL